MHTVLCPDGLLFGGLLNAKYAISTTITNIRAPYRYLRGAVLSVTEMSARKNSFALDHIIHAKKEPRIFLQNRGLLVIETVIENRLSLLEQCRTALVLLEGCAVSHRELVSEQFHQVDDCPYTATAEGDELLPPVVVTHHITVDSESADTPANQNHDELLLRLLRATLRYNFFCHNLKFYLLLIIVFKFASKLKNIF
jgi:hypothetical protein